MIRKWFDCDWKHAAVIAISIFACMLMFRIGHALGSLNNEAEFNDPGVSEAIQLSSGENNKRVTVIEDGSDNGYMIVKIYSESGMRSSLYIATVRKTTKGVVYTSFTPLFDSYGTGLHTW